MANQTGINQYGSAIVQPRYGDVKKETQLTEQAPLSGAPRAAAAFNLPRRAGRQAQRGKPPVIPPVTSPLPPEGGVHGPLPPGYPNPPWTGQYPPGTIQNSLSPALLKAIAGIPGASPLVQTIFGNAS